jgi:hypothetical protein
MERWHYLLRLCLARVFRRGSLLISAMMCCFCHRSPLLCRSAARIVADRGMISQNTVTDLEQQGWPYILGARMRRQNEVREQVLADQGRFRLVYGKRQQHTDPAPLKVKDVWVEERRYVVCVNEEEVDHDRQTRTAIVAALQEQLRRGDKSLGAAWEESDRQVGGRRAGAEHLPS